MSQGLSKILENAVSGVAKLHPYLPGKPAMS